jgi:hypothetical protein
MFSKFLMIAPPAVLATLVGLELTKTQRMLAGAVNNPKLMSAIMRELPSVPTDTASVIVKECRRQEMPTLVGLAIERGADIDMAFKTACEEAHDIAIDQLLPRVTHVPKESIAWILEGEFRSGLHGEWDIPGSRVRSGHGLLSDTRSSNTCKRLELAGRLGAAFDCNGRYPPLFYAIRLQDKRVLRLVLDKGVSMDKPMGSWLDSGTAVEWAVYTRNPEILEMVIKAAEDRGIAPFPGH